MIWHFSGVSLSVSCIGKCFCSDTVIFWLMHRSSETKLFDDERMDYTNVKLYGILRGDSGISAENAGILFHSILVSHKSGYIKIIRQAFDFLERYFKECFVDQHNKFVSTCIESMSATKLLVELETSSVRLNSEQRKMYLTVLVTYHFRNSFLRMKIVH